MREDWIEIELGKIAQIYNGNSVNSSVKEEKYQVCKTGLNYIGTKDIAFNGTIDYENGVKIPFDEPKFKIAPKNCILVCSEGGSAGKKTAFTNENICFGNKLYAIVNKYSAFEGKYIFYYTRYRRFFESFKEQMNGIIGGVSIAKFSNIPISLAPILEQKAIVAKIEQLFSELDKGTESLKTAQAKLKIYRQAVLKKAFEGELTKEWREQHTNLPTAEELLKAIMKEKEAHYQQQFKEWKKAVQEWEKNGGDGKKPSRTSKPKILSDVTSEEIAVYGNLPTHWKWEKFNNVTYKIGDIDHKMPKEFEGGLPYLSTGDLKKDGSIDFKNAKTISRIDFNRLALKIKPERNDIIFPRYGTIGRNILVCTDQEFLVSYACAIIKNINSLMNCKFVYYYSLSPVVKKEIKKYVVQTTQANIGIASIENFLFPLCSLQEQNQIVQEIESRLSICDKIEETIQNSLTKAEALRQSILKKAFEGKLLDAQELEAIQNHPEYESAEKLLQRIKLERAK